MSSVWLGEGKETKRGSYYFCLIPSFYSSFLFSFFHLGFSRSLFVIGFLYLLIPLTLPLRPLVERHKRLCFWFGLSLYRFPLYLFSSLFPFSCFVWFSLLFCVCKRDEDKRH